MPHPWVIPDSSTLSLLGDKPPRTHRCFRRAVIPVTRPGAGLLPGSLCSLGQITPSPFIRFCQKAKHTLFGPWSWGEEEGEEFLSRLPSSMYIQVLIYAYTHIGTTYIGTTHVLAHTSTMPHMHIPERKRGNCQNCLRLRGSLLMSFQ